MLATTLMNPSVLFFGIMGEKDEPNALGTRSAFLGSENDSYYPAVHELNEQYITGVGINGIHYIPVPLPQWIHHQQTPQNYVQFLAENMISEVPVDASAEASSFRLVNDSADMIAQEWYPGQLVSTSSNSTGHSHLPPEKQIRCPLPYHGWIPLNGLISSEHQTWEPRGDVRHASLPYSEASAAGSSDQSRSLRKSMALMSDQRRRMRIAERIEALGELLSCSKQGGRASLMDEIIDHIEHLQFQMKGCGHYVLDGQVNEEPLEDTFGKLLEVNPSVAIQLLENKGLYLMPMALAEGLQYHE